MDAFESLVAALFQAEGYWVRTSYKIKLTKAEKVAIDRPTCPRWEIDVVAYRPKDHALRVVECKSFFDSTGVLAAPFVEPGRKGASRYKLFTEQKTREVVIAALLRQLHDEGSLNEKANLKLCLAAGKIATAKDQELLEKHFEANHWELIGPRKLRDGLLSLAAGGYENSASLLAVKLLLTKQFRS